jgi:DNA-binding CsgD family transcriptional regulator
MVTIHGVGSETSTIVAVARGESGSFDELLLRLYRGLQEPNPWTEFLAALCEEFRACTATLVVRQPVRGDRGDMYYVGAQSNLVEVYRTAQFEDDPFLDLEEGVACNINDRVPREVFLRSRFYNELLALAGNNDILALNVVFGGTYLGSLKISRSQPAPLFGLADKSLMMRIYPHLKMALEIFERSRRRHLENNAYIKAIDQLAFGVIILNERAHVIRVNETASRMMKETQLLRVVGNLLQADEADHELVLSRSIKEMLNGERSKELVGHGSLLLSASNRTCSLYLLLRPIYDGTTESGPAAGVAIYLSGEKLQRNVSIETFGKLYHLSRAELALVTELMEGQSIVDAATVLGISENTARVQLRSVFTKTDTHRQADLMRLVLTSLAIIA